MPKTDPHFIIPFAKPSGMTSFSSLWQVKHAFGIKKVGHTGTLDSFADGLLVALSGKLTKLVQYITDFDKTYRALFYFGKETDTLDPEGAIIAEKPLPVYADFAAAVAQHIGTLQQLPPVYSAVKQNGERLSDKIRRGETVTVPPRVVTIYDSTIEEVFFEDGSVYRPGCTFSCDQQLGAADSKQQHGVAVQQPVRSGSCPANPETGRNANKESEVAYVDRKVSGAVLRIRCSKGTYIRSLVRDIAHLCGSAAYVYALRRTTVGPFTLAQAAGFSALPPFGSTAAPSACAESSAVPQAVPAEDVKRAALPLSEALARAMYFQTAVLQEKYYAAFMNGKPISGHWFTGESPLSHGSAIAVFYQDRCAGLITKKGNGFSYEAVFGLS